MSQPVPSIGRVVHFVYGDKHVPAIIIEPNYEVIEPSYEVAVTEGAQAEVLIVFTKDHAPFTTFATFDPEAKPATWHWPEYVPAK